MREFLRNLGKAIDGISNQESDTEKPLYDQTILTDEKDPVLENKEERSYHDDVLMPMLLVEEEKLRANQDSVMQQMIAAHQAQFDGFDFSCVRFGDFLTISMTRKANIFNKDEFSLYNGIKKFSTTINLSLVSEIKIEKGHEPDLEGSVSYMLLENGMPSYSSILFSRPQIHIKFIKKSLIGTHGVKAIVPGTPTNVLFTYSLQNDKNHKEFYDCSYPYDTRHVLFEHVTGNYPRPAADDVIQLDGLGMKIYAPFGKGDEVHSKILEAIEKGYEPKPSIVNPS